MTINTYSFKHWQTTARFTIDPFRLAPKVTGDVHRRELQRRSSQESLSKNLGEVPKGPETDQRWLCTCLVYVSVLTLYERATYIDVIYIYIYMYILEGLVCVIRIKNHIYIYILYIFDYIILYLSFLTLTVSKPSLIYFYISLTWCTFSSMFLHPRWGFALVLGPDLESLKRLSTGRGERLADVGCGLQLDHLAVIQTLWLCQNSL